MQSFLKGKSDAGLWRAGLAGFAAALIGLSGAANAASVGFFLDQSNRLPDGTNYLEVTIADGVDGAIDFTVSLLEPLTDADARGLGIHEFNFNIVSDIDTSGANIVGLPDGWRVSENRRQDGFGIFDIQVSAGVAKRVDELTFSIVGIEGDSPEDYAALSRWATATTEFFGARVWGFEIFLPRPCRNGGCDNGMAWMSEGQVPVQPWASFGGSLAVPLPPVAWLFLSGLVPVVARMRRRAAVAA
jgi:hypothetical protein